MLIRRLAWVVIVLPVLLTCSVLGQNPLTRFYKDVDVRHVQVPLLEEIGRRVGDTVYLTEREVVELALRNNLDINVERHGSLVRQWELEEYRSAYDPTASFGFTWDRATTPAASVLQGGDSVTDINTDYQFGYTQPFSTGSTIELSFQGTRNRTTNFFSSLVPAINTQFELLVRQNLLEGFGKATAEYDIEISRNDIDISEQEFRRVASDLITQAQNQFRELEYALKDVDVKQKSFELAETILEQNQARFEVGTASRLEVVQTEAEVATRREELITAQFNYRRAQDQLIKLITSLEDPRIFQGAIVPDPQNEPAPPPPEGFEELVALAEELRPELRQSDLTIANREVELERTRDELKPSLDLVAGYQQFGLGGRQVIRDFSGGFVDPPIVDIIPGGAGDSLSQLFSADYYGYVVGFDFQMPIRNTDARARNAQAQIELGRAEMERKSVSQQVGLEIRDNLTLIEMNRARLEAADTAVRAARERLEGEQARFDVGMGTTRELIEAQRDLLQAESLVVRARADLIQSYNELDNAVGRTFNRFNIVPKDSLTRNVR